MENYVGVPVAIRTVTEIQAYAASKGWSADAVTIIQNVLANWLDTQEWSDKTFPSATGYRWKNLVLSSGTKLRMRYQGTYHYADIDGDAFVAENGATSPGQFVNAVTGTSRSAWRDLEIKRPNDANWIAASTLKDDR